MLHVRKPLGGGDVLHLVQKVQWGKQIRYVAGILSAEEKRSGLAGPVASLSCADGLAKALGGFSLERRNIAEHFLGLLCGFQRRLD